MIKISCSQNQNINDRNCNVDIKDETLQSAIHLNREKTGHSCSSNNQALRDANEQIHQIYEQIKNSNFNLIQISNLDSSQLLEEVLWPNFVSLPDLIAVHNYGEDSNWEFFFGSNYFSQNGGAEEGESSVSANSDDHESPAETTENIKERFLQLKSWILLISIIISEKLRVKADVWPLLLEIPTADSETAAPLASGSPDKFKLLFYLSWYLFLQPKQFNLTKREASILIQLFIYFYQSLEQDKIRYVCMSLCGLSSWFVLGPKQIEFLLNRRPELQQAMRILARRNKKMLKRFGSSVRFNDINKHINLTDRFSLMDRDAVWESLCQFAEFVEVEVPQKINKKNLLPISIIEDEIQGLFSVELLKQSKREFRQVKSKLGENRFQIDGGGSAISGGTAKDQESTAADYYESPQPSSTAFYNDANGGGRNDDQDDLQTDDFLYCERFLEFLIDLVSQLPTRRVVHPLLSAVQLLPRLRHSLLFRHSEASLIRQLTEILSGYDQFEIDDATGEALGLRNLEDMRCTRFRNLQLILFEYFKDVPKLKEAALRSISYFSNTFALRELFIDLSLIELLQISGELNLIDVPQFVKMLLKPFLASFEKNKIPENNQIQAFIEQHQNSAEYRKIHDLMVEVLVSNLKQRHNQLDLINKLPLYPTEHVIWNPNLVPAEKYEGEVPLALPKLNLQFLSIRDYLLRNFHLFRLESTCAVRDSLEFALYQMKPTLGYSIGGSNSSSQTAYPKHSVLETQFKGTCRMACPIERFSIVNVKPSIVAAGVPLEVRAEIVVDLNRVPRETRRDWDTDLRQFDVLFLLGIWAPLKPFEGSLHELPGPVEFPETFGVVGVRGCEIVEVLDEEDNPIDLTLDSNTKPFGTVRTYRVLLDPYQYQYDLEELAAESYVELEAATSATTGAPAEKSIDIYSSLNLLVRRKPAENNFKAILQTIRQLMGDTEDAVVPVWLHDLFLGYGDPRSAHYKNLENELNTIDFVDTFIDTQHIKETFGGHNNIELYIDDDDDDDDCNMEEADQFSSDEKTQGLMYKLDFIPIVGENYKNETDGSAESLGKENQKEKIVVKSYKMESRNPYPQQVRKINTIRFTPAQISAIRSGVNPGLTIIVGPPGTGKTDTAVQIAHLLHKNFKEEKILIIAHSNQALNDLFEKIAALDVDERYLLRLGMGEKQLRNSSDRNALDLETRDFSKFGRVNFILQRRIDLLKIVDKLAQSLNIIGDYGASCESAIQFYRFHVVSRMQRFRRQIEQTGREGRNLRVILRDMRMQDGEQNKTLRKTIIMQEQQKNAGAAAKLAAKPASKSMSGRGGGRGQLGRNEEQKSEEEEEEYADEEMEGEEEQAESHHLESHHEGSEIELLKSFDDLDDAACTDFKDGFVSVVKVLFPFRQFFADIPDGGLFPNRSPPDFYKDIEIAEKSFRYLNDLFKEIEECRAFELLRTLRDRGDYLLTRHAKIIAMTCTHAALVRQQMVQMRLRFDSLIMEEAAQILEVETFIPMVLQKSDAGGSSRLKRVILIGDHNQLPPVVKSRGLQHYSRLDQSMFSRFIRLNVPFIQLDKQGRCRSSLRELFDWRYQSPPLSDLPQISCSEEFKLANVGLCYDYQFINVEDFEGRGEFCPSPYFYQNKGEAEYAVALYMYMRLLGYPASKIAILSTYNGQKELLKEILQQRCAWNPAIGLPGVVSTVDKFQGQQSDYVILSLVRTKTVGYMRDVRRVTVCVSRARLGLYVFGRFSTFSRCPELQPTLNLFRNRPHKLALNLDEEDYNQQINRTNKSTGQISLIDDVYGMWKQLQKQTLQVLSKLQPRPKQPPPPPPPLTTD